MSSHCIEVVVYKVKNPQTAETLRRDAKAHIEAYPGFLGWHAVTSAEDPTTFSDILTWKSLDHAKAAATRIMSDPGCAPFMAEVAEVVSMGHYV